MNECARGITSYMENCKTIPIKNKTYLVKYVGKLRDSLIIKRCEILRSSRSFTS